MTLSCILSYCTTLQCALLHFPSRLVPTLCLISLHVTALLPRPPIRTTHHFSGETLTEDIHERAPASICKKEPVVCCIKTELVGGSGTRGKETDSGGTVWLLVMRLPVQHGYVSSNISLRSTIDSPSLFFDSIHSGSHSYHGGVSGAIPVAVSIMARIATIRTKAVPPHRCSGY
jgi:hypothetical protein